ncbi:MAG: DUF2807 domain-containing protein, partial [Eudoraea sp.]|nr:DUF2807 domain-containing protein [Eudoraea sp.]
GNGCNGENVLDCFQNAGDLVQEEILVDPFTNITVFENVSLVLSQGPVQRVLIETGEFLRPEVNARVENGTLLLTDTNDCNLFRDYGLTTVYVTAPNIETMRSSTGFPISSEGTLAYNSLSLISESFNNPETETTDGSFDLDVATQNLSIVANGIAYFQLRGTTNVLNVTIAAGDSRVEAENLLAQEVILNHRGSNDIRINPQDAVRGVIRGTGDVVSFNRPPTVEVEEIYRGRLIFRD